MSTNTARSEKALSHLKSLKPYDGWSLDTYTNSTGEEMVMLKRRNVPLYKKGFESIAYDEHGSKCIVGITSSIGDTDNSQFCRGIVLVDANGSLSRDQKEVRIKLKKNIVDATKKQKELNESRQAKRRNLESAREAMRSRGNTPGVAGSASSNDTTFLSDIFEALSDFFASDGQSKEKLVLMFIGMVTILKILSSFVFIFYMVILPLGVLYAMSTVPSNESFDAKKELKRVLRGHHLPENHPDKPKDDWISSTIARVTASVATELATSLGYELSFMNFFGVCNFVTVHVPVANQELYWIGIFGTWKYLFKRDLPKPGQD